MSGNTSGVWIALAALVPLVVLMLTSFVKVSVVLSLLRNAIGAPDAPSGLVVMGISLVLTFFVMAPVVVDMVRAAETTTPAPAPAPTPTPAPTPGATGADGARPVDVEGAVRAVVPAAQQGKVDQAVRAIEPLRAFLTKHASAKDRETFVATSQRMGRATRGDELWVLAPAFLATELREAFAIAVLIFVPFLVIDLVVGLGLAALGLSSTSPQNVALPLKLLLFVAVDGWRLLLDSLLRGYV
ncbi:MAG TPA: flagellar type III secretion system pore protein FliP [Kofleriaceae bacterium]|nr:flagellar type III secretion system pore protein FliP [Kofleriaceae bacterium]